jgi:hypothetical protein
MDIIILPNQEFIMARFLEELKFNDIDYVNENKSNVIKILNADCEKKVNEIKNSLLLELYDDIKADPPFPIENEELLRKESDEELIQMIEEIHDNKEKKKRGRPKMIKEVKEVKEKKPIGRPKKNDVQLTFKERLDADPDFKKRQKDYLSQKIKCETCDKMIARSSVKYHNESKSHQNRLKESDTIKLKKQVEELVCQLKIKN